MNIGSTVQSLLEITKLDTLLESCSLKEMLGLLYCPNDDAEDPLHFDQGSAAGPGTGSGPPSHLPG